MSSESQLTDEQILSLVPGPLESVRPPLGYRVGILLATIVMLSLLLAYLGIIGSVAAWIYYYPNLFSVVFGSIFLLFMIKPLFRWRRRSDRPVALTVQQEPLLFAFIEQVCRAVRAPTPRRIQIDCDVNASAGFRLGLLSLVLGNDLVLKIGAPLLEGLRIDQFAGVLAHEFGHFSQGTGMRLTYVIRRVSHWFVRVVYERDALDNWLLQVASGLPIQIGWVFWITMLFVWLVRQLLWLLMMLGNLTAGLMLRQMEFDADSRATALVGAAVVESTHYRMTELSVAYQGAESGLADFYEDGRLCDNFPTLVAANLQHLIPEKVAELWQHELDQRTGLFDSHPCQRDRIEAAQAQAVQGAMDCDLPATRLLHGADELFKQATLAYYRTLLDDVDSKQIVDTESLLECQQEERESYEALERFFPTGFGSRPVQLTMQRLGFVEGAEQPRRRWHRNHNERQQLQAEFERLSANSAQISRQLDERLHTSGVDRICYAIQLLFIDAADAGQNGREPLRDECRQLVPVLEKLAEHWQAWGALSSANAGLEQSLRACMADPRDDAAAHRLYQDMDEVSGMLVRVCNGFNSVEYPFEHAQGSILISDFLAASMGVPHDPVQMYHAASALNNAVSRLHARVVGRLCAIAEQLESELQLDQPDEP